MIHQAPGFYRRRAGGFVITALADGYIDLPVAALTHITPEDAAARLTAQFRSPAPRARVNCYLVQGGGRTILVDTGGGGGMGATLGRLPENLAAAGTAPEGIDLVLLTHAHRDHTGGLVTSDGAAAFPEAAVGLSQPEHDYWYDAAAPAERGATARQHLAPYTSRLQTVSGTIIPGITAIPMPGHTPGHTGFRIGDGADAVLIWGDVMHVPELQSADPGIGLVFDVDPAQAIATRREVLQMAATQRLAVAGMHLNFPGFAHVAATGAGYSLVPEVWAGLD